MISGCKDQRAFGNGTDGYAPLCWPGLSSPEVSKLLSMLELEENAQNLDDSQGGGPKGGPWVPPHQESCQLVAEIFRAQWVGNIRIQEGFFSSDVSSNAWVLFRDLKWHLYEVGTLGSAFMVILDMFCMRVLFFS